MEDKKLQVRLRNGFSDRNGIKTENTSMQLRTLDERTRVALINVTNSLYEYVFRINSYKTTQNLIKNLLRDVYLVEIHGSNDYDGYKIFNKVNNTIRNGDYASVFTIIEYISKAFSEVITDDNYKKTGVAYNKVFEKEYVGYRFLNDIIMPITNSEEQSSIETATKTKFSKVNEFLTKASILLSDRSKPDYENTIKESISAVEEVCNILIGKKGPLGTALDKLIDGGLNIHPCLKSAFDKLYGYTSDASGIRHAGQMGGKSATFEEARFMLVTCSAFVNYLLENHGKYNEG